jgi:hypothetical protein
MRPAKLKYAPFGYVVRSEMIVYWIGVRGIASEFPYVVIYDWSLRVEYGKQNWGRCCAYTCKYLQMCMNGEHSLNIFSF